MKKIQKINFKCFIPDIINNFPIKKTKPSDFKWFKKAVEDYKFNKPYHIFLKCVYIRRNNLIVITIFYKN